MQIEEGSLNHFNGEQLQKDENDNPIITSTPVAPSTPARVKASESETDFEYKTAPVLSTTSESETYWGGASASIGVVSLGISGSKSKGWSKTTMAFTDINGDGYPDYITDDQIEYTNIRGSRDGEIVKNDNNITPEYSVNNSTSFGFSGGATASSSNASGDDKMAQTARTATNLAKDGSAGISIGTSQMNGSDYSTNSYIDVNGDGLPDRIYETETGYKVCLNLGFKFAEAIDYGIKYIQKGSTTSNSSSLGVSSELDLANGIAIAKGTSDMPKIKFGLGYGINSTQSRTLTLFTLRDINGDGLVDQIYFDPQNANGCYVAYNLGNRFSLPIQAKNIDFINEVISQASSANINAKVSIPIWLIKITLAGSLNFGMTNDFIKNNIQDINGDGFPDLLERNDAGQIIARLSTIGCTNKLESVTNSLGGKFTVDYSRSEASIDHPGGKWVMSSVTVDDGINCDGESIKNTFDYFGGKYDRYEREFLGFARVNTNNINTENGTETKYRCTTQNFDVSNCYVKGNLINSSINEITGNTTKKLTENANTYYTYSVNKYVKPESNNKNFDKYKLNELSDFIDIKSKQYIVYSPLKYNQSKIYSYIDEVTDSIVNSQVFFDYYTNAGTHGEIRTSKFSDKGGLKNDGTGSWNYRTETEYLPDYSLPKKHTVYDFKNIILRQLYASWEPSYSSHLTQVKTVLSNTDTAVVDMKYDCWGNITQKILPANYEKKRMTYNYEYKDPTYHFLSKITDSFGYSTNFDDYDYWYGVPRKTTDINGNVMTTTLDTRGRVISYTGPKEYVEGAAKQQYTLLFEYHPEWKNPIDKPMPYALTKHYDPANPTNDIETVTFVDGYGRPIQVKKDGVVDGQEKMIVSGLAKYDDFGRVKETYYPKVGEMSQKLIFDPIPDSQIPTSTTYDVLDRVLSTTTPDNITTSMAYNIAEGNLKTTVTDAFLNVQETFTNGSGKTVKTNQYYKDVIDPTKNATYTTLFEYDPINQLHVVTDAAKNTTTSEYDLAGRRTQVTHPASGITKFYYDVAGNLTGKQTANLLLTGDTITYKYDYNRLKSINYPKHSENNVTYTYGTATDNSGFNRKGRLVYQEDGSGAQEFSYGKMGEVTEVRRSLVIPNQAVATYDTKWTYDCWNRVRNMTYPDGEIVTYQYNRGGLLEGIIGSKNGSSDIYVDYIEYDKFEQRTEMDYGNSNRTYYTYNPANRQLSNLKVNNNGNLIMNNTYQYDSVSNVKSVTNSGTVANNMGGVMVHNYNYDNLYRLKSANGTFTGANGKTATYTLGMTYDNLHNIATKKQNIEQNGVQFTGALNAGYDLTYTYANNQQQISNIADDSYRYASGESQEHKIKSQNYGYDANGNLLYVNTGLKNAVGTLARSNDRKMLWDEENRMLALSDNGFVSNYFYDAAGERTVKMSGDGEGVSVNGLLSGARTGTTNFTAYINPYLVLNNGGYYSKHIYIGSQRILSKLGSSDIFTIGNVTNGNKNPIDVTVPKAGTKDFTAKYADLTAKIKLRYDSLGVMYKGTAQGSGNLITSAAGKIPSPLQYYYHSDHLGSSSLITDAGGDLVQHLEYIPFGEVFIDERPTASSWSTPYKFNAKELDEETGLYYYGARYMDPRTSVWISVDPLAEKYAGISSYVYCNNNPVNMIDPDGRAGHAVINQDTRTITVSSTYIFYGSKATPGLSANIANEIAWQYNGANGSVQIDGVKYGVKFDIHYQTVSEEQATEMSAGNTDASQNFVRVEETNPRMNRSFFELNDNTGFMNTSDNLGTSTTAPHETGHGYGLDHPSTDQRGNGQPGIMAARGTAVDAGYTYNPRAGDSQTVVNSSGQTTGYSNTINPQTRRVTPQNILDIFKNIVFKNGAANIGNTTNKIYDANGYEKK